MNNPKPPTEQICKACKKENIFPYGQRSDLCDGCASRMPTEQSADEDAPHWSEVCYECKNKLTEQDHEAYEPQMCCSGFECGCMGMPTEPPYCLSCIVKGQKDRLQSLTDKVERVEIMLNAAGHCLDSGAVVTCRKKIKEALKELEK